ncbi:MAG: Rieske 2Fe-2S domain-containing protein [Propionicimonas sp.]|uniref:cytochrome bc1 complex Rieske iron-sulfur subunit n=1 Tax=Propionicimonas sp. TaxID=1955623 RepID=UPI002B2035C9|nr:Rieske 2Fe-2S domain-containing protein [Propionicimonas sp.]MEA4945536.1 Rieske 2Fe-2S domain-containing protein [Propionicimonas sp.]MEA5055343.1 Rieske 2Fe-2S domain-containing protein [Propionicimonas sp.]MEA5116600.1 Rieske 2Fe-2S domain-containing protein [Propionicimonas sp.]
MSLDLQHPIPDPGLEEHQERFSDTDERAGRRAYTQVVGLLAAVPVLAIAFVVIYFAVPSDATIGFFGNTLKASSTLLGVTAGLAVLLIGVALIHWARTIMGDQEVVEERHPGGSAAEVRQEAAAAWKLGAEQSGLSRRALIGSGLAGGIGILVVPAVVLLADMGPWPTRDVRARTIEKTLWAEGIPLVNDVNKLPLKAADIEVGQLVNAQPLNLWDHHGADFIREKAKSSIIVVRMDPASIRIPESRKDWQVDGVLAYSKICTHVGCSITLWEQQTHHLLCPCHQSTFDLGNSGVVVFGPAARSLPQLPITTDANGYLIALSDFTVPVGPSYFERDSSADFKDGDR